MSKMSKMIKDMTKTLEILKDAKDQDIVPPEENCFFKTLNGSYVYCYKVDDDGDGNMIVLTGGHGVSSDSGEEPGETYYVNEEGYFKSDDLGAATLMSLVQAVDIKLP